MAILSHHIFITSYRAVELCLVSNLYGKIIDQYENDLFWQVMTQEVLVIQHFGTDSSLNRVRLYFSK